MMKTRIPHSKDVGDHPKELGWQNTFHFRQRPTKLCPKKRDSKATEVVVIRSHIGSTQECGVVLKLDVFSHLKG